ncbi:MAG: methylmalonyl Co-A mutase-associated GTPase MeaB [Nitrospiraceae bacterium]
MMTESAPVVASIDADALVQRVKAGDIRAIARTITLLENHAPPGREALQQLAALTTHAVVIGITGYPGAGKSTLIDRLAAACRRQGHTVGILAVDPSSRRTGGAILGDRIRMQDHALDPKVYVRSMATRGQHGGLAPATKGAVRVLEAAGYGVIFVETIGVGQDEVEIRSVAQTVVAVVAPGLGDEIQAMKAGLLEVADIIVVNKGDRDGADLTLLDLQEWHPHVIRAVAIKDDGIPELLAAIAARQRR